MTPPSLSLPLSKSSPSSAAAVTLSRGPESQPGSFLEITHLQLLDIPDFGSAASASPLGVRFSIVPSIKGGSSGSDVCSSGGNGGGQWKSTSSSSSSSSGQQQHHQRNVTAWSGPPTQQQHLPHQSGDGNNTTNATAKSFRWSPTNTDSGSSTAAPASSLSSWKLVAQLKDLYNSKLKIQVVYRADSSNSNSNNTGRREGVDDSAIVTSTSSSMSSISDTVVRYETELSVRSLCVNRCTKKTLKLKTINSDIFPNDNSIALSTSGAAAAGATGSTTTADSDRPNESMMDEKSRGPTIKLRLLLQGPMRPVVASCLEYFHLYCRGLDHVQDRYFDPVWVEMSKQSPVILSAIPVGLGIGSVPVITTAVVVSPIVIGITILFFPITIPIIVLGMLIVSSVIAIMGTIVCTTRPIRTSMHDFITSQPFIRQFVLTSPIFQSIIYDTGDDDAIPNPISILRWYVVPETIWYRLLFSLTIDLVGSSSYLIPVVGEAFDGPWAPVQSMLIMALYNNTTPNLKWISLAEEWLPFMDVLPSATIGWMTENMPTLLEEWNELVGGNPMGSGGINLRVPFIMGGLNGGSDGARNNGTEPKFQGNKKNNNKTTPSDPIIPPEQKRDILREMQNLSGRLSVKTTPKSPQAL